MLISKEKRKVGTKEIFKIQKEGNEVRVEKEGENLIVINGENFKYLFIQEKMKLKSL